MICDLTPPPDDSNDDANEFFKFGEKDGLGIDILENPYLNKLIL